MVVLGFGQKLRSHTSRGVRAWTGKKRYSTAATHDFRASRGVVSSS